MGLLTALSWGVGDFATRFATRWVGTWRSLFYTNLLELVGFSLYLLFSPQLTQTLAHTTWVPWAWGVGTGLVGLLAMFCFFRAFEVGKLALVAPITASYPVVTTALALLSGEHLAALVALGMALTFIAIILASIPQANPDEGSSGIPAGVSWAILAAVVAGVGQWLLGFKVIPDLGVVIPAWLGQLVGLVVLPLAASMIRQPLARPNRPTFVLLLIIAGTYALASVASAYGMRLTQVSLVTVLGSLYAVVAVLLATLFLRERLAVHQWLAVGLALVGIVLVNLP